MVRWLRSACLLNASVALVVAMLVATPRCTAEAQDLSAKSIKLVVGLSTGSGTDVTAHLLAQRMRLSWYGAADVAAPLGGAFHSRRRRLISSQVGKVASSHRSRWTSGRRLTAALSLLDDPVLDALIAPACRFEQLPERLPAIFSAQSDLICQLIQYP
jgi:hypothetical protein